MKRMLFFVAIMAMLVSCENFYMVEGTYQVSIKNDTAYTIDAKLSDCKFMGIAPGDTSSVETGSMEYSDVGTKSYNFYIAESGLPLSSRGRISVTDGCVYSIRVYYDFYSQEYRYAIE